MENHSPKNNPKSSTTNNEQSAADKLEHFMREISRCLNKGKEFQAQIPEIQSEINRRENLEFFQLNHHLQNPQERVPTFDKTRQRIRSVGLSRTGLPVLTPNRVSSRYLIWDPERINDEFLVKCAFINQYLVEKGRQSLTVANLKKYFELCQMDEAVFIDSILANGQKFQEYVSVL